MACRCTLLVVTILSVGVSYVSAEIEWINSMDRFSFQEAPGNDFPEVAGNEAYRTNWTLRHVYTLLARDKATGSSDDIIYGFNNAADRNDITLSETSSHFRIEPETGRVFLHGVQLDYEQTEQRSVRLELIAKKRDNSEASKRTSVCLLTDFNDNRPKFTNNSLSYRIKENTNVGDGLVALRNIVMTDADSVRSANQEFIEAEVQFCIINNEPTECKDNYKLVQTLNDEQSYKGNFVILKSLDYEVAGVVQVQIKVKDGYFETVSDITINVLDEQDRPPFWKKLPKITVVDDGTLPGNLTINVEAEDQDTGKRPINYSFKPGQAVSGIDINEVFEINRLTGVITNKVELDLEDEKLFRNYQSKLVRADWQLIIQACEIIDATVTPNIVGTGSQECTTDGVISVQINDVNDNTPLHVNGSVYIYRIFENDPEGKHLDLPPIVIFDRDTDLYNKYRSEFVTPSEEFSVGGTDANPVIRIKNADLLDYDLGPRQYNLTLRTYDTNNRSLESIAYIRIILMDENDNRPLFTLPSFEATIPEDSQEGTNVRRITATDIDSNDFGTDGIRYGLIGSYTELFDIDPLSGQVTVAACSTYGVRPCLDYDYQPKNYILSINATDRRGSPLGNSNTITLTVKLLGVNDNSPTVPDYDRQIIEGASNFIPDLAVVAKDKDEDSVLIYAIESQSPGQFWSIHPTTGIITVTNTTRGIKFKDGDQQGSGGSRFELLVKVTDGKYNAYSDVSITVIDQNDNPPVLIPSYYEISINENTPINTYILTVTAQDADDPTTDNGRLQYNIISGDSGKFNLDQATGNLSSRGTFDHDITKRYQLQVVVNDLGQPQLSANATVVVNILDNNNKAPSIDPFLQEHTVMDNVPIGHLVGTVNANDPDIDAVLRFEWFGPKDASSDEGFAVNPETGYDFRYLFALDYETGTIRVNQTLDSRRAALVSYSVRVIDVTPTPNQYGPGRIVFNIKPFNMEPPEFNPYNPIIYIDEEQPIGSVIISLIATDDNGIRLFQIPTQPDNFFTINPTTGSVSILNRIDFDDARKLNSSTFTATVIDTGDPELTATASVTVIFRNINDNFPQFQDPVRGTPVNIYTARIPENSPDGTTIGTAFAFDSDRPDNNTFDQIRYYMDDDRFDVDEMTGRMFVRLRNGAVLDRESNPRINTRVIARDNPLGPASNQNQRAASVQVTLTDVNDNCPQFSSEEYRVTIFETIGVGTDILQLFTTDRDIGNNARSVYSKVYGEGTDYEDFFDARRESGRVYVKKNLVRHTGTYLFYVQATDNLGSGCTRNTSVKVIVNPSANAPPVWVIPPVDNMTIYVLEEQYNGMLVYDISARDEDSGVNGVVDYSFIYNGETLQATPEFKINKLTGVIHAEIVYDREKVDKYVLLLKVTDRGETPLETTRFLTVVVLDVNDNKPVFADREYQIDITENQPLGDIRQIPSATDLDLDPEIVYDIISGNEDGVFALDRTSRMLSLVKPLDRESKGIYYIDVQASNDEADYTVIRNRRRRATDPSILTLKIIVGDINDLAPVFLQDEYFGCISARSPYDKHIMTIQAIDRDAVGTGVVRYRITGGNKNGSVTLFDIHPKFGVISNKVLMRRYADRTFFVTVNARDNEDIEAAESANTVAKIFVNQPGNEVKLLITQNTGEVRLYKSQIQSILQESTDLTYVCINDIQDHVVDSVGSVTTLWSDVYITGIRRNFVDGEEKYIMLTNTELKNIVDRERYERKSDFDLLYIKEVEAASSSHEIELEDQAVLIILIIIAVLIFLVIIFCIVAFMCIRAAKRQKKALLLHKTHATPPVMIEPEPVIVEPVVYDNRAYVVEEQQPVDEDERVIGHDPVHVQYAVVQKRSELPQAYEDDQDAIVVELRDDEPQPQVVYDTELEPEYRIETEVVNDNERI